MPRFVRRIGAGLSTTGELIVSLWNGPYWWLVFALAILLPTAVVLVILQAAPAVAPFVYTPF